MEPFRGMQLVIYHRAGTTCCAARPEGFDYIEPKETLPPSAAYMASLVDRMNRAAFKFSWRRPIRTPIIDEIARRPAPGPRPPELRQRGPGNQDRVRVLRPDLRRARPRAASGQDVVVRPLLLFLIA